MAAPPTGKPMSDQQQILLLLGEISGKQDRMIAAMDSHVAEDRENFSDLGHQLGKVEKKAWWFGGVAAAIAFLIAKVSGHQ